jgi:branched-chain amino acid aminotransferase
MLKKEGTPVEERRLSVAELAQAMKDGTLEEAWGCGTAAVVSPIGELSYKGEVYIVNEGKIGELTQHLYDTLTSIQWGKAEDPFNWTVKI